LIFIGIDALAELELHALPLKFLILEVVESRCEIIFYLEERQLDVKMQVVGKFPLITTLLKLI
jgi:hypothetical protein